MRRPSPLPENESETARRRFAELADAILDPARAPGEHLSATRGLHAFCHETLGLAPDPTDQSAWMQSTMLPSGLAIAPYSAATCLFDYRRTVVFAQGLNAAIAEALRRFEERPLRLVYAGTGPFAPLALLQTRAFGPEQLRFTLIDIHEDAVAGVGGLIGALGLQPYLARLERADASVWQDPEGTRHHLAVAEVMQRGLGREPQVAVSRNLVRQLVPGGFLVPGRVEVGLWLLDAAESSSAAAGAPVQDPPPRRPLGRPFVLTGETAGEIGDGVAELPLDEIVMPETFGGLEPFVRTRIEAWDGHVLGDRESGLTIPYPVAETLRPGHRYRLGYRLLPEPGLRILPARG